MLKNAYIKLYKLEIIIRFTLFTLFTFAESFSLPQWDYKKGHHTVLSRSVAIIIVVWKPIKCQTHLVSQVEHIYIIIHYNCPLDSHILLLLY